MYKGYKNFYQWAKANHLCTVCGKVNNSTILRCTSCDEKHKQQYLRHHEKYKTNKQAYGFVIKQKLFAKYGSSCVVCGEDRLGCLQLDHILGDGANHRKTLNTGSTNRGYRGGIVFYTLMLKLPIDPTLQILCANCHTLKHCKYQAYAQSHAA